jgi:hypothetical protein
MILLPEKIVGPFKKKNIYDWNYNRNAINITYQLQIQLPNLVMFLG